MLKAVAYWLVAGALIGVLSDIFVFLIFKSVAPGATCNVSSAQLNSVALVVTALCYTVVVAIIGVIYYSIFSKK